ncbi:MAG: hypothetical protein ACPGXL_06710, partial [Chitinophagales bacterium]
MFRKAKQVSLFLFILLPCVLAWSQPQEGFVQLGWYNGTLQTARHSYETKPIHVAMVYNVRLSDLMEYNGWKEVDELVKPYTVVFVQSVRTRYYPDNVEIVTRGDIEETLASPPEGKTVVAPEPGKGTDEHLYQIDDPKKEQKATGSSRYANANNNRNTNNRPNQARNRTDDGKIQPSISVKPLPPKSKDTYTQNNSVNKGTAVRYPTKPFQQNNPNPPQEATEALAKTTNEVAELEKEIKLGENFGFAVGGFIEADHISYFKNQTNQINGRNQGTISLDISALPESKINWFANVEYLEDLSDNTRTGLRLDELYIDLPVDQWRFRLGKQIMNWQEKRNVNILRPYPLITPRDFTDYLEPEEYRGT